MASQKISQLTAATTPLTGTEELPIVQSGVTKKTTAQEIANLGGGGLLYTSYVARVSSSGPVTIFENTTGTTVSWNNPGYPTATLTNVSSAKVYVNLIPSIGGMGATPVMAFNISQVGSDTSIQFTYTNAGLNTFMVEIRIYP